MSGTSFPISKRTLHLLSQHKPGYLSQIIKAHGRSEVAGIKTIGIRATDKKSGLTAETLPNGDQRITLTIAIDDDNDPSNGRIYLKDEYTYSGKDRSFRGRFNRTFKYNGQGPGGKDKKLWKKTEDYFDNPLKVRNPFPKIRQRVANAIFRYQGVPIRGSGFAKKVGRVGKSYYRGVGLTAVGLSPKVSNKDYPDLRTYHKLQVSLKKIIPNLGHKALDPQSHLSVVRHKRDVEVIISTVVDEDQNPANGRVIMRDRFILDAGTLQMQRRGYGRKFSLAPESKGNQAYGELANKLNATRKPTFSQMSQLIRTLQPWIQPMVKGSKVKTRPATPKAKVNPANIAKKKSLSSSKVDHTSLWGIHQVKGPKSEKPRVSSSRQGGGSYTFSFAYKAKGNRADNIKTIQSKLKPILYSPFKQQLKRGYDFSMNCSVSMKVDPNTGNISKVTFKNVQISGARTPTKQGIKGMLKSMAMRLRASLSVKKDISEIRFSKFRLVAAQ